MRAFRVGVIGLVAVAGCALVPDWDTFTAGSKTALDAGSDSGPATDGGGSDSGSDAGHDAGFLSPCPSLGAPGSIFVDANVGDDATGDGQTKPYRSITHALAVAAPSPPPVICVRAGRYAVDTTAEQFPLRPTIGGTTLRGEGADRVTIAFTGHDADAGVPYPYSQNGQAIVADQGDITVQGFTIEYAVGSAIDSTGQNTVVTDAIIAAKDETSPWAITAVQRLTIARSTFSGTTGSCLATARAQLDVSDSTLAGCGVGILAGFGEIARIQHTTFRGVHEGVALGGAVSLDSTDNTYDTCAQNGIRVSPDNNSVQHFLSQRDTFVRNYTGILISNDSNDGGAPPAYGILDDTFQSHSGPALVVDFPIPVVMRNTKFMDGTGPAMQVDDPAVLENLDISGVDGGANTFQSTAHPNNGGGICIQVTSGVLYMNEGLFSNCPPTQSTNCGGNIDIGHSVGTSIAFDGCQVSP